MAIFKKNNAAIQPIANKVDINLKKEAPLTGGNSFQVKSILSELPADMGEKTQYSTIKNNHKEDYDNMFAPNLFGSWADIYEAFMGSYRIVEAPNEIKRHQKGIKHLLFIANQVAIYRGLDNRYLIGNVKITNSDEYGRILKGSFFPFNYQTKTFSEDKEIKINENNNNLIAHLSLNIYNIPLFIYIKYFVNLRNILYNFKNVNIRVSSIHTIVGVKGGGKKILTKFLEDLFNLNNDKFPSPIQVLDISVNENNGDISFNFTDLNNQIKIPVEYKGNEINLDIDSVTKELFRVAGIRYDTSASSGTFQDRPSKSQIFQAANYFDARENSILEALEDFSIDCKEKFNFHMEWGSIYRLTATEKNDENVLQSSKVKTKESKYV